ncbi:MAG TPA: trypsin-like peptidase domain-containing protein [Streptosporangiaceae bacterium]
MSTNFGEPSPGRPGPDERAGAPAGPDAERSGADEGSAAAGSAGGWYRPYGTGGPGGYGTGGYGSGPYAPGGYGPGGYGPAGYGPGGPGPAGQAPFGGGQDDKHRARRRTILIAGASAVVAAALTVAGFGAANAFGATTLTTAQIASKVDPGLVDIVTNLGYQQGQAAGTGMVLTSSGEVLTNNHVIRGATQIKATDVGNGRTYTAKVVGYDEKDDVAVLQLQGASGLQTVSPSSAGVSVGDKVVALGNAEGKGGTPSKAVGKVVGLGRTITASDEGSGSNSERLHGMIQHNAPIQPGDSGGALVNRAGQIVGMNTAASTGISMTGFQSQSSQGKTQAFAIPISKAERIADQIEAGQASARVHIGQTAFLGVQVESGSTGFGGFGGFGGDGSSAAGNGAAVAGVVTGSAADQAGLTQGDEITSVAGHPVSSASDISSTLATHHPGDKITIGWTDQAGQSHTATVTLTTGPAA